jgi:hypothetical protein
MRVELWIPFFHLRVYSNVKLRNKCFCYYAVRKCIKNLYFNLQHFTTFLMDARVISTWKFCTVKICAEKLSAFMLRDKTRISETVTWPAIKIQSQVKQHIKHRLLTNIERFDSW